MRAWLIIPLITLGGLLVVSSPIIILASLIHFAKYQEALNKMYAVLNDSQRWHEKKDLLQELVDRATPMKPTNQYLIDFGLGNYGKCKRCKNGVNYQQKYCGECGQKLDWSEDEERRKHE